MDQRFLWKRGSDVHHVRVIYLKVLCPTITDIEISIPNPWSYNIVICLRSQNHPFYERLLFMFIRDN